MKISPSPRRLSTVLALVVAMLLAACADNPSLPGAPASEASGALGQTNEPPPLPDSAKSAPPPAVTDAPLALRPDHPQTYTVVPGDTLWSIAGRFLNNPWQWRQIWRENPQISNPNRIYPGDVLRFSYDADGKPHLEVGEREEAPLLKLSPEVRTEELTQPIPPVPRDAIRSFLTQGLVLRDAEWKGAPYIVADDDQQIMYTDRDRVYARGAIFDEPRYQVFRPTEPLIEPGSGRSLGVVGIYLGQAILEKDADPATLTLTATVAPIAPGDRLFPLEAEDTLYNFDPHPVGPDTDGFIIANLNPGAMQITQYSSVVINLGHQEGLQQGNVLAIYSRDREVQDPVSGGTVKIPGERAGLVMVYKVYDLVSYALVMQAERAIRLQDRVTTP